VAFSICDLSETFLFLPSRIHPLGGFFSPDSCRHSSELPHIAAGQFIPPSEPISENQYLLRPQGEGVQGVPPPGTVKFYFWAMTFPLLAFEDSPSFLPHSLVRSAPFPAAPPMMPFEHYFPRPYLRLPAVACRSQHLTPSLTVPSPPSVLSSSLFWLVGNWVVVNRQNFSPEYDVSFFLIVPGR